ncbi:MAG: Rieske (2Fe-2S) protein [bacterium]
MKTKLVTVARKDELRPGESKVVAAKNRTIALYNVEGTFYATDNICPHKGGPLGEGELQGASITCPWHGWQFDVVCGANSVDSKMKLVTYEVHLDGDHVQIKI